MENSEYLMMYELDQRHWWFTSRRKFLEKIFQRFTIDAGKKRTIVDVGAGIGGMISFLSQYGKVIGIEPNPHGRFFAKKRGISLLAKYASDTGIPANSCDIVCFFDVLYHKNINEKAVLAEAFRLMKSNGYLIVTDSAFEFLNSPHDVVGQGARRYSRGQMSAIIERAGFRVQYSTYSFFLIFPAFALWRVIRSLMAKFIHVKINTSDLGQVSPLLNAVLEVLCLVEAIGYRYWAYPWGSSLIVVAQKTPSR